MDAKKKQLKEKYDFLLKQAAGAAVELQVLEQGEGTPHYDQIELPAHAAGQEFSRLIQSERARELAASHLNDAPCPDCGCKCKVEIQNRTVN